MREVKGRGIPADGAAYSRGERLVTTARNMLELNNIRILPKESASPILIGTHKHSVEPQAVFAIERGVEVALASHHASQLHFCDQFSVLRMRTWQHVHLEGARLDKKKETLLLAVWENGTANAAE
jgi:hypothetical protein